MPNDAAEARWVINQLIEAAKRAADASRQLAEVTAALSDAVDKHEKSTR